MLEKLREIDEVAYLRYASVHRRFEEVDEFVDAIQALGRRIKTNAVAAGIVPDRRLTTRTSKHMVAFKEEFPYLRCESGQLFEFDQRLVARRDHARGGSGRLSELVADRSRHRKHRVLFAAAKR